MRLSVSHRITRPCWEHMSEPHRPPSLSLCFLLGFEAKGTGWWVSLGGFSRMSKTLSDGRFYRSYENTERDGHFCREKYSLPASLACVCEPERRILPHFRVRALTKWCVWGGEIAMPLTQAPSFFSARFKIYVSSHCLPLSLQRGGFGCNSMRG